MKKITFILLLALMCLTGHSLGVRAQGASEPTEIGTPQELVAFSEAVNGGQTALSAKLTADIDMSGVAIEPIGSAQNLYVGTFDGQDHVISNLTIEKDGGEYVGLFGQVTDGATVRNLILKNAKLSGKAFIGIVGGSSGSGVVTLDRLGFEGEAVGTEQNVSGIIGVNMGSAATFRISNCYVTGKVSGGKESAAITGWTGGAQSTITSCWSTAEVSGNDEGKTFFRNDATVWSDCFDLYGVQVVPISEEAVASGELTFRLNGINPDGVWRQTLGEDGHPVFLAGSKQVYAVPEEGFRCDGLPLGNTTYSNSPSGFDVPSHTYRGGLCSVCGDLLTDYLTPDAEGCYELGDAQSVVWFANYLAAVADGSKNAKLTADISFTDEDNALMIPIGTSPIPFSGTFDGQGHKVSGFNMEAKTGSAGFFGSVLGGTVKNFIIEGELSCVGAINGAIGIANNSTISNVHSFLNILVPVNQSVTHTAGVVGDAQGSTVVTHCTFNGVLTVEAGHDCFGGVVGYTNTARVEYCANYGQVLFANNGCYAGGIVAYINNGSNPGISNCLNVGEVRTIDGSAPVYSGAIIGRLRSWNENAMGPNYWLEGSAARGTGEQNSPKSQMATQEQMNSGEIAWLLNNQTFLDAQWFQTLGEDEYPLLDETHGLVYGFGGNYGCVQNGDVTGLRDGLVSGESGFVDDLKAQKAMKDAYVAQVNALASLTTMEELAEAYSSLLEAKAALQENASAYQAYIDKVNETIAMLESHPEIICDERDILEDYLYGSDEPGDLHPYGQSQYIVENELLGTEEIKAETARIDTMLDAAISNSLNPGSDVTRFVKNPDFSSVVDGWEGTLPTNYGGSDEVGYALLSNGRVFDLHQTITGLQNGYYLLSVNALYRPAKGTDASKDYAGFIYANDNVNYIMAASEDVVREDEAVDGENCYLTNDVLLFDSYGEALGYTPGSGMGMAIAIRAGRYDDNKIIALVTDGTLTLGVRNDGTCAGNDWLEFGNVRLTYAGSENNGAGALDYLKVALASQVARANNLIQSLCDVGDYAHNPNFSQQLRDELAQTVQQAEGVTTAEEAYQTVQQFSTLFQAVLDCKRAYVGLMKSAESYYASVYEEGADFTDDEKTQAYTLFEAVVEKWRIGEYSTHAAWAQEELAADPLFQRIFGQTPDVADGIYQISDAQQMRWFAQMVNTGNNNLKACLTADIDLASIMDGFKPIGSSEFPFTGTFDGQNHKLTGFAYIGSGDNNGFFGQVLNGTVENFTIEGTLKADGSFSGAIGWTQGAYIRNIHSALVIDATEGTTHHVGGVVGSLRTSSEMERCTFTGILTVGTGSDDCFGGIAGYSNEYVSITHCANYGQVLYAKSNCYCGGILGYLNNSNFYGISNCLNVGEVRYTGEGAPSYGGSIVGRLRDHTPARFGLNYWLEGSSHQAFGQQDLPGVAVSVTASQLASGEVCCLLNDGETQPVWYQTLGEDLYPVLDETHKEVQLAEDGTYQNPVGIGLVQEEQPVSLKVQGIYDLQGRKLERISQKGIYIIDGRRVLVR